jgi:hypothetical protein
MKLKYLLIAILCLNNQTIKSNDEIIKKTARVAALSIGTGLLGYGLIHPGIAARIYPQNYPDIIQSSPNITAISIITALGYSLLHHGIAAKIYPEYYSDIIQTSPKVAVFKQSIVNGIFISISLIIASKSNDTLTTEELFQKTLFDLTIMESISLICGIVEYRHDKQKSFDDLCYLRDSIGVNTYNNLSHQNKKKLHAIDLANGMALTTGVIMAAVALTDCTLFKLLRFYHFLKQAN